MKLRLLLFSNQKYRKVHGVLKYTPGKGGGRGLLDFKNGDAPCTYLGSEIWSRQDCLKSREGEVISGTVFLYFYISMNLFSVINSLMTEKGELITWGL